MPIEVVSFWVLIVGVALLALAGLWLAIKAFRTGFWWGVGLLVLAFLLPGAPLLYYFLGPLQSLVPIVLLLSISLMYIPAHWKESRGPLALGLLGLLVVVAALVVGQFSVTQDPRVEMVKGEKHITLTAAKGDEIELLKKHPDVVELYMANNAKITDETLKHLEGMASLRLLDLDDTAVTDEGLTSLAKLPKLEVLRLSRTKVTDTGFKTHLAELPKLTEVTLRGTEVATSTLRAWTKAGKALNLDRKYIPAK
jgi:hypothetical protein